MLKDYGQKNARLGGGLRECPMRSGRESTLTKQTVVVGTICDPEKPAKVVSKTVTRDICHYNWSEEYSYFLE